MSNVAKLSFMYAFLRASLNRSVHLYVDSYQDTLLFFYRANLYKEKVNKKDESDIENELLEREVNAFIKALVKKDENFSYITDMLLRSFDIRDLEKTVHKLHCSEIPDFSHSISEICNIFITLRFDQLGNIRESITFEQAVNITKYIGLKMENEWLHAPSFDLSSINKYLISASDKAELSQEMVQFINGLKTHKSNTMNQSTTKFSISDVITADIVLNVILSKESREKKKFYYEEFVKILTEVINLRVINEEMESFFITLPKYSLIKLIHYKDSFLKLLRSDKQFTLQEANNIISALVDQHILDSILGAQNRNNSNQETADFIVKINEIFSNSTIGVYSQDEINSLIHKVQEMNQIKNVASPNHVRSLEIFSACHHDHPIFYHLLDRLIRIDTLSLEEIKKFIQVIVLHTSDIVNDNRVIAMTLLLNDHSSRFDKTENSFGTDYIINHLLSNGVPIEEIAELFSGILRSYGYHSFHKLLYEKYQPLNTSVHLYCCMKDRMPLSIKEFSLSFINQFNNEIEEFDHEFWQREYIAGILSTPQTFHPSRIIEMLMTLKSELQYCHSYRDIAERAFSTQQNDSKFWSELKKIAKLELLDTCDLAQQTTQQILNDNSNAKVKTLSELSMNQWINDLLCLVLAKTFKEEEIKQPSSSLHDASVQTIYTPNSKLT